LASNLKRSKRTVGKRLTDIQSRVSTIEKRPAAKALSDAAVATANLEPGAVGGWMIDTDAIYTGVKTASGSYAPAGSVTISSDGHITANKFRIDSNGDAFFSGSLSAATGTFSGSLSAATGTFSGSITAGTIDIGGFDTSSFHVDTNGNMWLGGGTFSASTFSVSSGGVLKATSGKLGKYKITTDGTLILENADVNDATVELALGTIFLRDADIDNATAMIEMDSGSIASSGDYGAPGDPNLPGYRFVLSGDGGSYFYRTTIGYDPSAVTGAGDIDNEVVGQATYFVRSTNGILMRLKRPYAAGGDFMQFRNGTSDSEVGRVEFNGVSNVAYQVASDARLKENVVEIENAISLIKTIAPVEYNFILEPLQKFHGFIAQDMYEAYPQVVSVGAEDVKERPWAVNYSGMTPLLTAAIKEIIKRLEDLESRS
jgi:hypothetical protein